MAKREDAKPGDILLYKANGAVGSMIRWSQWDAGRGNYEYCHIAQVFDEGQAVEMNPPKSRKFGLDQVPWNEVDIFRFNINGGNPYSVPQILAAMQAHATKRLGMRYDYLFIVKSLGVGLLARIGFSKWAQGWARAKDGDKNRDVCSQWLQENNEAALAPLDIFPETKDVNLRPSEWPLSPYLVKL